MALPVVTIVGRPNVGKSSLLNALARQRVSIVDARAGITRDRVSVVLEHGQRWFELVDTGGIGIVDDQHLEDHVEEQIRFALAQADLVLLVVSAPDGIHPLDARAAELLRPLGKPVLLVANKVDEERHAADAAAFCRLGFGEPLPVSALHGRGRTELLEAVLARLGPQPGEPPEPPVMKLAIVGKRNAGKSTLVNRLAGEPRCIVSQTPGTTRDAVDVRFELGGRKFVAIDTAGIRRKRSMDDIDFYSFRRALRSIQRADVALHLIDATVPVSEVDVRIAQAVVDEHKPLVIGVNKWDLAEGRAAPEEFEHYLNQTLPVAPYAPIVLLSAASGRNVAAVVDVALRLHRQACTRVPTARLNEALAEALRGRSPAPKRGTKPVKIYYATQVSVAPPTLAIFCNDPALVTQNYRRFLENRLREALPLHEVPIRLLFRARRPQPRRQESGLRSGA